MPQRHWLDPLARRLLQVSGVLPADPIPPPTSADPGVERDLLALKLQHNPNLALRSAAEVQMLAELGWRLDVNRASRDDWQRLPGISATQVDLLLRLQAAGVQLSGAEDLRQVLELERAQIDSWLPVLSFHWYGEPAAGPPPPPLDLNRATTRQLSTLGLSPERSQRLLRERARRPFSDLADLQQRLQLPPTLVEAWIGRVRFGTGHTGPVLPPKRPG
jgi:DNA uptake protein ComE-like DNA-binding protein